MRKACPTLLFSAAVVTTDKLALKKYFFLASEEDPDFDTWYQVTGFLSMLIYFFLSLRYYTLYKKLMVLVVGPNSFTISKWVLFDDADEYFERNKYVFSR